MLLFRRFDCTLGMTHPILNNSLQRCQGRLVHLHFHFVAFSYFLFFSFLIFLIILAVSSFSFLSIITLSDGTLKQYWVLNFFSEPTHGVFHFVIGLHLVLCFLLYQLHKFNKHGNFGKKIAYQWLYLSKALLVLFNNWIISPLSLWIFQEAKIGIHCLSKYFQKIVHFSSSHMGYCI